MREEEEEQAPISMQILYSSRRRPWETHEPFSSPLQRWMGRTGCKLCVTDEVLLTQTRLEEKSNGSADHVLYNTKKPG